MALALVFLALVFTDKGEYAAVPNPILQQTLHYFETIAGAQSAEEDATQPAEWAKRLLSAALSARLGCPDELAGKERPFADDEVPKAHAKNALKMTWAYLAFLRRLGEPKWLMAWEERRTEAKVAAKKREQDMVVRLVAEAKKGEGGSEDSWRRWQGYGG